MLDAVCLVVLWCFMMGFPDSSVGKKSVRSAEDPSSIPGLGRSPGEGKGYPLQCSGLKNSMDYIVCGVAEVDTIELLSLSLWCLENMYHHQRKCHSGEEQDPNPSGTKTHILANAEVPRGRWTKSPLTIRPVVLRLISKLPWVPMGFYLVHLQACPYTFGKEKSSIL